LISSLAGFSQEETYSRLKLDSVALKRGQVLIIHDKTYLVKRDTVFIIPSSIKYSIKEDKGDLYFSNLEQKVAKHKWTKELHNIIITPKHKIVKSDSLKTSLAVNQFISYAGRPIRHIKIKQLDVFGPTILDTTRYPKSWIERTGNKMHFTSKKYLIVNSLLFKEGDNVKPETLADNERILRGLPYLEDAFISVHSVGELNDSVDVTVITKDVWSEAFNIQINNISSGQVQFWNRNIFGFGHEVQNNIPVDSRKHQIVGYDGHYKINNIAGTFIKGAFSYLNSFNTESFGLSLDRGFITPNIKYAGGISIVNSNTKTYFKVDTSFSFIPLKFNKFDGWIGRSFVINSHNGFSKLRQNITFLAGISRDRFIKRPDITQNSYYQFQNKTLVLGTISFERQSFFKSNLIYSFGRTEDIPVGTQVQFTFGIENNEFFKRKYFSNNIKFGKFFGNFGYAYTEVATGGFVNNANKPEQAEFQVSTHYFSNIFTIGQFNFRQFLNLSYTRGIHRYSNEHLTMNNELGIAGFMNDSIIGNRRFNMHWETVCFTPWYVYDFRFVLFAFADHSWIKQNEGSLFDRWPYTGIGLGIRIRNERLVFNTIQIRFTLYPNIPAHSRSEFFDISGEPLLNPPSFAPKEPALLEYR